jgi:hypothetical protein
MVLRNNITGISNIITTVIESLEFISTFKHYC